MYANAAYLGNTHFDNADFSKALTVKSCGNYRLINRRSFTTYRPQGRRDFQLLYIASGQAHFFFDENETIIPAGNVIIYQPDEMQKYIYYSNDKPEVFWVHFSGTDVRNILNHYGLTEGKVFHTGTSPEFNHLFLQIIHELQTSAPRFGEMISLLLNNIFLLTSRYTIKKNIQSGFKLELDRAVHYFNDNYKSDISIEDYAAKCHVSLSWFIRSFKKYTGLTPMQYILSARIASAQALLESSSYTVSEIASIVGYSNQMYFSRIFKKQTGMSPLEYRKKHNF
jgi:AraC-like DNA-binding protein